MTFKYFILIIITLFIAHSCTKLKEKKIESEEELFQVEEPYAEPEVRRERGVEETKEKVMDFSAEDIGIITDFTPEIFVKVTILYNKESKRWIEEVRSLPSNEQEKYVEEANKAFFKGFGIKEEKYLEYSQKNIDELNKYLDEHPEFLSQMQEYYEE